MTEKHTNIIDALHAYSERYKEFIHSQNVYKDLSIRLMEKMGITERKICRLDTKLKKLQKDASANQEEITKLKESIEVLQKQSKDLEFLYNTNSQHLRDAVGKWEELNKDLDALKGIETPLQAHAAKRSLTMIDNLLRLCKDALEELYAMLSQLKNQAFPQSSHVREKVYHSYYNFSGTKKVPATDDVCDKENSTISFKLKK